MFPSKTSPTKPSPRTLVKFCGFTLADDAKAAIDLGADALGFNFYPKSKRALRFPSDLGWIAALPASASKIAVVVNAEKNLLSGLLASGVFDFIQFHGDEDAASCSSCPLPWIKALPAGSPPDLCSQWKTDYLLFDAIADPGEYGGTGKLANWSWVSDFAKNNREKKILLAGGLTPKNVRQAILSIRPFAVDTAGGIESSPGKKDRALMAEFLSQASSESAQHPLQQEQT